MNVVLGQSRVLLDDLGRAHPMRKRFKMWSTVRRVPLMTALPAMTLGFRVIRSSNCSSFMRSTPVFWALAALSLRFQAGEVAGAEGGGHGHRHLGLGQHNLGAVAGHLGLHLLLAGGGQGATLFGLGAGDAGVGLGLVGLQAGADVLPHVDVGNVDGDDFKGRLRVQAAVQHRLGNAVGPLHHLQVALRRADRGDDALAHPGDDRLFRGAADELLDVGPHGDPGTDLQLDAVLGDGAECGAAGALGIGAIDHLGTDAGLDGVNNVAARQVDGRRAVEIQIDVGAMGGDDRLDDVGDAAAGEEVGLQPPGRDAGLQLRADAGLNGHDLPPHDDPLVHVAEAHADEAQQAHVGVGHVGLEPNAEVHRKDQHRHGAQDDDDNPRDNDGGSRTRSPAASKAGDCWNMRDPPDRGRR